MRVTAFTLFAISLTAVAAPTPPAPDQLTENAAAIWGAQADGASASVFDDITRVKVGGSSIRFETSGGFDCWLFAPKTKDASWNLLAAGGPAFWVYAENSNSPQFQNGSPWIRFFSSAGNYLELKPTTDILNDAINQWKLISVPLNGSPSWNVTKTGTPDLSAVKWMEIHADTWGAGFKLWVDGLRFDVPFAAPAGLKAYALNQKVNLSWKPYTNSPGVFDSYAVYRSLTPITSTVGLTPIAVLPGVNSTSHADTTAANGVSYHYAVTARFVGGGETTTVQSVGPRTPRNETDLQVVSIARTPRFPRYLPTYTNYQITEPSGFGPYFFSAATGLDGGQNGQTKRFPNLGELVTYTATVRNRGTNAWAGTLTGSWTVNGVFAQQQPQAVSLAPGQTATYSFVKPWDNTHAQIGFSFALADARPANNALAISARSVAFLSFADATYIEDFREETKGYSQATSDDLFDWLNGHMARFNEMFAEAGTDKRVHFDVLEMLQDEAPDPSIDATPFAIFPFRYRAGEGTLRLSGYYDPSEDLDYGLHHEMGHQLGLIDLYRIDTPPEINKVTGTPFSEVECLMHGCSHFVSPHSAAAMTNWIDVAHGYYGQYLYGLPAKIRVRFLGSDGQPLKNASVKVYQRLDRPGMGDTITSQVKFQGLTDADGLFELPNVPINPALAPETFAGDKLMPNPFGYVAVVGNNGLMLFVVEKSGFTDSAWLSITDCNVAYYAGQTELATFDRPTSLGGLVQYIPPADLAEVNAANWTAWAQQGTVSITDDPANKVNGLGSVKLVTDGGFDTYAKYPGNLQAKWDLSNVTLIRMRCLAQNTNNPQFQGGSPWVRLGNADGYFEWHPTFDILNQAIGSWKQFVIPVAGDATWKKTTVGSPSMDEIHWIEVHADTWGAGFTLWLDDVGFDPPPCYADCDVDGDLDIDDFICFQTLYALGEDRADCDGSADLSIDDFICYQTSFAVGC